MPKLEFDPKFSIGNIVTIGLLIASLVAGWFNLTGSVSSNAREIITVSDRVTTLETNLNALIKEINGERLTQTRLLTQLQTDMSYTRAAVEDLRSAARGQ
jgi:hypothetical protein